MSLFADRNLFLGALLEKAIGLHGAGMINEAKDIYLEVLSEDRLNATALHYLGIYHFQTGDSAQAIGNLRLSCELAPLNFDWHNDLGNVLFSLQQFENAITAYEDALDLKPDDHNIWNNLGAAQVAAGQHQVAIESLKKAIDIKPEFVPALMQLSAVYETLGDKMASSKYHCLAFVLPPHDQKSKQMLGICLYFLGRYTEAAEVYRTWLIEEPSHPIAAHMFAACSRSSMPSRASDAYIEMHFDNMADSFDSNLVGNLAYDGPFVIASALSKFCSPDKRFHILDMGCGTGLCSPTLAPYAKTLIGIDLSEKMLQHAATYQLYDKLVKAEITSYLSSCTERFDIVVASDTLIYFGRLNEVFSGVAQVLNRNGLFIFTTEAIEAQSDLGGTVELHPSGRYRHADRHIDQALLSCGLVALHKHSHKIRDEVGLPVFGTLVIAKHTAAK